MTLLEMLVALAIFGFIGSALYPVIQGALVGRQAATERVALATEARRILDRMEQDLLGNWDAGFGGTLPRRFFAEAAGGRDLEAEHDILESTTLVARGVTAADAFVGGEDLSALAMDRGDQAQVLWRIDSSGQLLRQQRRPPSPEQVDWRNTPSEILSERATVILEFYEPDVWLDEWSSVPGGSRPGKAPLAVRTTVRVSTEEAGSLELVSTVVLPTMETMFNPGQGQRAQP